MREAARTSDRTTASARSTGAGRAGKPRAKNYLRIAGATCNASFARRISDANLAAVLVGCLPPQRFGSHLRVFFSEVPLEVIAGAMRQEGIPHSVREQKSPPGARPRWAVT